MKRTHVTADPTFRSEHELIFHIRKKVSYEPNGLRAIRALSGNEKIKIRTGTNSKKALDFKQRVPVKAKVVKMRPAKGVINLRTHVRYLERSGTGIDGNGPEVFGSSSKNEGA